MTDPDRVLLPLAGEYRPKAAVRVQATYSATDGTVPESVEVSWETQWPSTADLAEVINALARVPQVRREIGLLNGASR